MSKFAAVNYEIQGWLDSRPSAQALVSSIRQPRASFGQGFAFRDCYPGYLTVVSAVGARLTDAAGRTGGASQDPSTSRKDVLCHCPSIYLSCHYQ